MRYLTLLLGIGLAACGASTDADPSSKGDIDSRGDAGADDDSPADDDDTDADDDSPADDDAPADDDGTFTLPDVSDLEPPDSVLPDADPETVVEDLSDEEFAELCEPLVDSATHAAESLTNLCDLAAVLGAQDSGATTDDEYRMTCINTRSQCEATALVVDESAQDTECGAKTGCSATVGEVDACNASLVLGDAALLTPAADFPVPKCEDLDRESGASVAIQASLIALLVATQLDINTDDTADNACSIVQEKCPELFTLPDVAP